MTHPSARRSSRRRPFRLCDRLCDRPLSITHPPFCCFSRTNAPSEADRLEQPWFCLLQTNQRASEQTGRRVFRIGGRGHTGDCDGRVVRVMARSTAWRAPHRRGPRGSILMPRTSSWTWNRRRPLAGVLVSRRSTRTWHSGDRGRVRTRSAVLSTVPPHGPARARRVRPLRLVDVCAKGGGPTLQGTMTHFTRGLPTPPRRDGDRPRAVLTVPATLTLLAPATGSERPLALSTARCGSVTTSTRCARWRPVGSNADGPGHRHS